jgi:5,5'-dehydrodivanillate O-demethylase
VPVDDENTLSISWFFMRVPKGREPYVQEEVPTWVSPVRDEQGRWIDSHVINQDIIGWVGQGRIADRTKENLRSSDLGIVEMRKRFFADMEKAAKGEDPSGIIRDPAKASCIALPDVMRRYNVEGVPLADYDRHPLLKERLAGFRHHFGQPPDVRRAFEQAMGI